MFDAILSGARREVEHTIDKFIERAMVVAPFLAAGLLLAAAGTVKLMRELGTEMGLVVMAGLFVVFGAVLAAVLWLPKATPARADEDPNSYTAEDPEVQSSSQRRASPTEQELITAAFAAVAPVAAPTFVRVLLRNLPILAAIAAAVFILTRPGAAVGAGNGETGPSSM